MLDMREVITQIGWRFLVTFPLKPVAIIATKTMFLPFEVPWSASIKEFDSVCTEAQVQLWPLFNQDCYTEVETPVPSTAKKIPGVKIPPNEVVLSLFLHYCVMRSSPNAEQKESREVASG